MFFFGNEGMYEKWLISFHLFISFHRQTLNFSRNETYEYMYVHMFLMFCDHLTFRHRWSQVQRLQFFYFFFYLTTYYNRENFECSSDCIQILEFPQVCAHVALSITCLVVRSGLECQANSLAVSVLSTFTRLPKSFTIIDWIWREP